MDDLSEHGAVSGEDIERTVLEAIDNLALIELLEPSEKKILNLDEFHRLFPREEIVCKFIEANILPALARILDEDIIEVSIIAFVAIASELIYQSIPRDKDLSKQIYEVAEKKELSTAAIFVLLALYLKHLALESESPVLKHKANDSQILVRLDHNSYED